MIDRFRAYLAGSELLPPGARVLVGYSGGADSTCLLVLLQECGFDVVAGHLHHGLRPEADREQALAEAFCRDLGIPFATGRADVGAIARDLGMGVEEAGRNARYEFFRQVAFRLECDFTATAHTLDDHVETVLLNLARGAGLRGLAGIPERRDQLVRPLLAFRRAETRAFCLERGYWFHDDPANEDESFRRVRVRKRVLPELRLVNAGVDEAIARLAKLAEEEDRFLDGTAARALEHIEIPLNGPLAFLTDGLEAAFQRDAFAALPPVLGRRAVRLAFAFVGGSLDHDGTARVWEGVRSGEYGSWTTVGGETVGEWNAERFGVRVLTEDEPFRYPLTVPGATDGEVFGWTIRVEPAREGDTPVVDPTHLRVSIPTECVRGDLYFRSVGESDVLRPFGRERELRITELMAKQGLTRLARRRLPVVCDLIGPVWVPGVALSERCRMAESGAPAWVLEFGPLEGRS